MKKTRRLNALQSFFLAMVGSLAIFAPAEAATILTDDFDAYSDGALTGQGDWTNYGSSCDVVSGEVVCDGSVWEDNFKMGVALSSGDMTARVKFVAPPVPVNEAIGSLYLRPRISAGIGIDFYYSDGQIGAKVGYGDTVYFSAGDWHTVRYTWAGGSFSAYVDDVWVGTEVSSYDWDEVWFLIRPNSGKAWTMWIDDIGEPVVPIAGYAPILTPTSPERNTETVVDFDDGFEVSGAVSIPTANTHLYDKLIITFRKPDSFFPAKTLTINLGGLTAGQSYNYSATTTVPITSSGDNFFKVGYTLTGSTYAGSYANNPPISEEALWYDNTWVKDSAEDAPAYLITPSIKPEQDALEDCGEYTGIDAVICNFRNFIVSAFLPTDDALAQIGGTMDALKNKFPMNYARAIGDSFSTITAGIDDDAGFSLTILGTSSSADTSFFAQDIGGGATLGGTIKLMLTFLVFMVFMFWGLGYMHRVLK